MADGDDGWWDDWTAILTPWGCDLTTSVPYACGTEPATRPSPSCTAVACGHVPG